MESEKQKLRMKEAPDVGYAWVVAVAACLINFIIAGLGRMSGILYVAFIENFNVTRKEATEPFTIRSSTRNLLGPVVGILGQQYGVRAVSLAGGVIGTISAAACYFAPSITWITIIWGAINGVGTALTSTLVQVIIGQYFDKHRTTASGIAFSGGCVGSFIFPVLLEFLLLTYGVQGTFLIMAGIIMNVIPAALILRKPAWMEEDSQSSIKSNEPDVLDTTSGVTFTNEGYRQSIDTAVDSGYLDDMNVVCEKVRNRTESLCSESAETKSGLIINGSVVKKTSEKEREKMTSDTTETSCNGVAQESDFKSVTSKEVTVQVEMSRSQISNEVGGGFLNHIKTSILLNGNPLFLLICLSRAMHFVTFVPVVTVIVDFGMDKGLLEQHGKYTIAALSLGDLIGRLCLGWVTDRGFVSLPKYMLVVMMLQGATTASLPLLHGMASILTMIAVFGMLQGSVFVRHPVLVSKYMGKDEQPIAMGSMNFLSGLLGFALPSFIGYFRDTLGSYDHMFYISGAMGSTVGMLWTLEPYLIRFSRKEVSS